jgi:Flp pilus assembly protein TadG
MKNNTIRKNARYRGAALVETAVSMVLLIMFILGIMGFGYLFLCAQQITNAARQGARLACVNGVKPSDYGTVASSIDTYLTNQGIAHDATTIVTDPAVSNSVKATVKGTGLDILNLRNIKFTTDNSFPGFPDTFSASVTMAKE